MHLTRRARVVLLLSAVLLVVAIGGGLSVLNSGPHLTPAQIALQQEQARIHRQLVAEQSAANAAKRLVTATLPDERAASAPIAVEPLFKAPLAAHHVVGYVPYWEVSSIRPADIASASDLVYSSVCPTADGSISSAGMANDCALGLTDLSRSGVADLVSEGHAEGDKMFLSVETTDDALIEKIDAHASTVAPVLAANLVSLERSHGFDGTNIDFEGTKPADREGYVRFVKALTTALRADDPGAEILLDSYAAAAEGSSSFFDPKRLAPFVNAIFVEDYSLESVSAASADSALESPVLGYSAVQSLMEYVKEVPADKLILGVPFYGFDFTTTTGRPGAPANGSLTTAETYTAIVSAAYPPLWDPATETPFSRFVRAGRWHQLWFDDPVSIALKVALAADFHAIGVGAWAFGMENGDPLMLAALTGGRAPLRTSLAPVRS